MTVYVSFAFLKDTLGLKQSTTNWLYSENEDMNRCNSIGFGQLSSFSIVLSKQITVTAKYKTQHNNLYGFKPGSSLSRAKAGNCTTDCNSPDNLSLFLCC